MLKEKDVQLADLSSQLGSKMETLQKLVEEEKRRQEEAAEAARQQQLQQQEQQNQNNSNNNTGSGTGGGSTVTPPSSGNVSSGSGYFTHPCPGMSYQSSILEKSVSLKSADTKETIMLRRPEHLHMPRQPVV